jgi:hypothetical protein
VIEGDDRPGPGAPAAADAATGWAATRGAEMEARARMAGKSEILDQLRPKDYPKGPHDKPQSMCPAFGSLRVGLRMRRVATVLSGSACCVYGLTFVSHFYGARRSVGYVPVQLRDAGHRQALRGHPRGGPRPRRPRALRRDRGDQPLRADRLGRAAAAAAEGDRRRADHRHRRAGLRHPDPCRGQGRARRRHARLRPRRDRGGPGAARPPAPSPTGRPSRCSARCSRPTRCRSARCSRRSASPPARSCPAANGASSTPPSTARRSRRSTPSTPRRSASSRRPAGPSSARPRRRRRHRGLARAIGDTFGSPRQGRRGAERASSRRSAPASPRTP